jgi:PAS domain S-box-containing protein
MTRKEPHRGKLVIAAQILALSSVYVGLGKLGMALSPLGGFATLIWPSAGVAFAALLLGGYRLWPGVALGALVVNCWHGAPPLVAGGIALGNTLEALAGALAVRSLPGFRASLERFKDVVGLAAIAAVASPVLGATLGVASHGLGGLVAPGDLARIWTTWWAGDLVGILIVAPAWLTWAQAPRLTPRPAKLLETILLGVVLVGASLLIFGERSDILARNPVLNPYLLFLPLIWAALRHGARGAATGVLLVACFAVVGTYVGRGELARGDPASSLITLHVFLLATSLATLALGAVVSEREHSRAQLDESESRFRSVLDGTRDAVYVKDTLGRYVIMNAPGSRLIGLPPEEVTGKDDFALFSEEEANALRALDREVARTGLPHESNEHLTIAGQKRIYHTTKTPYRDQKGNLLGVIGISRDITERLRIDRELQKFEERRLVEKELRELEERQRLAVEAANLGTWFRDLKSDELVLSPTNRLIHGIGADVPMSPERLLLSVHPEDREALNRTIARAITERTSYRSEYRAVWPDGSVHWISGHGSAFYDDAGVPERMLGVNMDITAQKRAEQKHADLLLRERAARAEAQAAASAKDEFLAVLSHELRTPLQSMLGWTQMLKEKRVDEPMAHKGLETIERNIRTQTQLIEDLLDISRIVAGTIRVDRQPMSLGPVIDSALAAVVTSARAKSIHVEATIDPRVGELNGDPERLEQVISNLLSNALKFTPPGGRVSVRLDRRGAAARLVVEDSGRGISAEFLPHVFERFRQADSTARRSHGGLGLGLSIVRHLVELHGGEVIAESPGEGRGATFTVTLPLAEGESRTVAPKSRKTARAAAGSPTELTGVRVLVVDDDRDACELLELGLRESGASVRAVHSVRDALDALESFHPDLLLSDIAMPEEDGYSLIRRVRAREAAAGDRVPAIALTAFASQADREQALALGFDEHLAKPTSPSDLSRTVARLLRVPGASPPSAA